MKSMHSEVNVIVGKAKPVSTQRKPKHTTINSEFYNIDDVMKLLPVSYATVYRLIKSGEFPKPIKLSASARSSFWVKDEVDSYIRNIKNNHRLYEQKK